MSAFFERRRKPSPNVLGELLWCTFGWGWHGEGDVNLHGKWEETPWFLHQNLPSSAKQCLFGYIIVLLGLEETKNALSLFCRWEHKAQGFQRTRPAVRTELQLEPVTPNPSPGCFLAYSIPYNHRNNWTHISSCVADAWKQWFSNWMHVINAWWALKEHQ